MPGIQAVILSSGFSRRLGMDKLSQDLCGKSVLQRVVENALGAGIDQIVVVLRQRGQASLVPQNQRISVLYNENAESGMSSSIKVAILKAKNEVDAFLFLNGDMPFFSSDSINRLIGLWRQNPDKIACVLHKGVLRGPVIFPRRYTGPLLGLEGESGGREILRGNVGDVVSLEVSCSEELADIDTALDLENARIICKKKEDNIQ